VPRKAARYALAAMTLGACNGLDHRRYGLPEAGHALRGVQRQYSGTIGRSPIARWAASLTIPQRRHVPGTSALPARELDRDPSRRRGPHPRRVTFKTKPELGVEMIERAIADGLPAGLVLADSAYGDTPSFAGACAARVWATPSAYTVRPRCGAWICWTPNR